LGRTDILIGKAAIPFEGRLWVRGIVVRWYQGRRLWIADLRGCEKKGVVVVASDRGVYFLVLCRQYSSGHLCTTPRLKQRGTPWHKIDYEKNLLDDQTATGAEFFYDKKFYSNFVRANLKA